MKELFYSELFGVELSEDELFSEAAFCAAIRDMELSGIEIIDDWR